MSPDEKTAKALGIAQHHVDEVRRDWNESPNGSIMREMFRTRLQGIIDEQTESLTTISSMELARKQGGIAALKLALDLVTKNPLTND